MAGLNLVLDIVTSYSGPKSNFISRAYLVPKGVGDRPDGRPAGFQHASLSNEI